MGDQEINRGAANHKKQETPVPPSIEKVAGQDKKDILGAMTKTPVQEHDRNEEQEISRRVKEHGAESDEWFHVSQVSLRRMQDIQRKMDTTIG